MIDHRVTVAVAVLLIAGFVGVNLRRVRRANDRLAQMQRAREAQE